MSDQSADNSSEADEARHPVPVDERATRLTPQPAPSAAAGATQSAVVYTILSDRSETLVYMSPTVGTILGYPPDAFMADRGLWSRRIHPDDRARVRAEINRNGIGADRYASSYRLFARDDTVVQVHDAAVLVHDLNGIPLCWQGVVTVASGSRFQRIVRDPGDLVSVVSTRGENRYHSPALAHLLGYDRVEDRPGPDEDPAFRAVVHPDDRIPARAALRALVSEPEAVVTLELRIQAADLTWRWLEVTGTNLLHDPGIEGLVLRWRDIDERRASAAALVLLNRAIAVTSNGVVIADVTDPGHPIVEANPAFERMTGYSRAELLGRNCRFMQGADSDPETVSAIRAALAAGHEIRTTLLNYRKDGTPFWNELHLAPVLDADGLVTHYVGVLNDVTAQRLADEELRAQGELLDQATVAVIATDAAGRVTHWNRHAERLYGWREQEAIGKPVYEVMIGPADLEVGRAIHEQLVAGQNWEGEFVSRRRDGTTLDVHAAVTPVFGTDRQVKRIVSVSHDVTARKAYETRLHHQATHDRLTGLANHVLFIERLEQALAGAAGQRRSVGLLYLDLDRFKLINDGLGHAAGDTFLVEMSQRLVAAAGQHGLVARLGGDEFAILMETAITTSATAMADRVLAAIAERFTLEGRELYPSVSIGLVLSSPDHTLPTEVLRAGDVALYQAKRAGRGTYVLFDSESADLTAGWLALEADLHGAIDRRELSLAYQPIISLRDGRVGAIEALLRWDHPERGQIPPTEFVPVAEETGLITVITDWILREACLQLAAWRASLGDRAPSAVNVNLTTRTLRDPGLIDRILDSLAAADLPPECLCLEITEHVLIEELRTAVPTLQRLRDRGIRLAIDDFGAGASSLASLRTVDVEVLKLDRSFAAFLPRSDSQVVIAAVTTMAHALGIAVTAEGIEQPEQLRVARESGCDWGQGFVLARPAPADEMTAILAAAPWTAS